LSKTILEMLRVFFNGNILFLLSSIRPVFRGYYEKSL